MNEDVGTLLKLDARASAQAPKEPDREKIAAALYAVEYDATAYEFRNAHEAIRTILLKMADVAIAGCSLPSASRETTKTRAKAPRIESVSCVHAAIIGLDGMWHCQKCGDAIDMAVAHSSTKQK